DLLCAEGGAVPFELSIVNLLDDPTVEGLVVSAHDITQLRAARMALEELASHDPLTGLPNRATLQEQLDQRLGDSTTAVIFLDLDGFKPVNDRYGHAVGDELLRQLGARLRKSVRTGDVVARYGGDEFVVIATVVQQGDLDHLTARLIEAIERPVVLPEGTVSVTASVGLAYAACDDTPRSLLARADSAMYLAKQAGRRISEADGAIYSPQSALPMSSNPARS
ncbi:MAG: GGDEF domain-containing protein, partial [Acidimicrobiales bacterium]